MLRRLPVYFMAENEGGASPPPPPADPGTSTGTSPPPPPPASPPPPPAKAEPPSYKDMLALIEDAPTREFAGRFDSFASLAKGGLALRQEVGKREGFVKLPKAENPDPGEVTAFRKAIGVPEEPGGYGLKLPDSSLQSDDDKNFWGRIQSIAHETNTPRAGLERLVSEVMTRANEVNAAIETERRREAEAGTVRLRQLWGGEYERKVELAQRCIDYYGNERARAKIKALDLTSDPDFQEMFAWIGTESAPHVPAIAQSAVEIKDNLKEIKAEYSRRSAEGKLNEGDFQERWARAFQLAQPQA